MSNILIAARLRNPAYNSQGAIDVELEHPEHGWIPFTASPDDSEQHGRLIYEHLTDPGNGWEIAPYVKTEAEYEAEAEYYRSEKIAEIDNYATNPIIWGGLSEEVQQQLVDARAGFKNAHEQGGWPVNVDWPELPEVDA